MKEYTVEVLGQKITLPEPIKEFEGIFIDKDGKPVADLNDPYCVALEIDKYIMKLLKCVNVIRKEIHDRTKYIVNSDFAGLIKEWVGNKQVLDLVERLQETLQEARKPNPLDEYLAKFTMSVFGEKDLPKSMFKPYSRVFVLGQLEARETAEELEEKGFSPATWDISKLVKDCERDIDVYLNEYIELDTSECAMKVYKKAFLDGYRQTLQLIKNTEVEKIDREFSRNESKRILKKVIGKKFPQIRMFRSPFGGLYIAGAGRPESKDRIKNIEDMIAKIIEIREDLKEIIEDTRSVFDSLVKLERKIRYLKQLVAGDVAVLNILKNSKLLRYYQKVDKEDIDIVIQKVKDVVINDVELKQLNKCIEYFDELIHEHLLPKYSVMYNAGIMHAKFLQQKGYIYEAAIGILMYVYSKLSRSEKENYILGIKKVYGVKD